MAAQMHNNLGKMKHVVLYAENEDADLLICERAFKKHEDTYQLRTVTDGRSVINWLDGDGSYANRAFFPMPQMVIIDSKLGDMTGLDVLQWIRRQRRFRDLPVILYYGSIAPHELKEYHDADVTACVEKDTKCDRLLECVNSILISEPVCK